MPHLTLPNDRRIAYHKTEGAGPVAVFFTGFKSDMSGTKALALEEFCKQRGQACLRFDYTGHGQSSGRFEEGTIGAWLRDARDAVDALTDGPLLFIGSSMGAWIATLAAREYPERLRGLITLAAAPDFTERLIWEAFTREQQQELLENGRVLIPNCYDDCEPYAITRELVEEGRKHLILSSRANARDLLPPPEPKEIPHSVRDDKIAITCPVRILHGTNDADVPWQFSQMLLERLQSADTTLTLVKGADHRLSSPDDLRRLRDAVAELSPL